MNAPATANRNPTRDPFVARRLVPLVASALVGSPFETRSRWPSACVVLRREEKRVTSRACFASWLLANDLPTQARECTARRVPPGHVLLWIDVDVPGIALATFLVFDLATAIRANGATS